MENQEGNNLSNETAHKLQADDLTQSTNTSSEKNFKENEQKVLSAFKEYDKELKSSVKHILEEIKTQFLEQYAQLEKRMDAEVNSSLDTLQSAITETFNTLRQQSAQHLPESSQSSKEISLFEEKLNLKILNPLNWKCTKLMNTKIADFEGASIEIPEKLENDLYKFIQDSTYISQLVPKSNNHPAYTAMLHFDSKSLTLLSAKTLMEQKTIELNEKLAIKLKSGKFLATSCGRFFTIGSGKLANRTNEIMVQNMSVQKRAKLNQGRHWHSVCELMPGFLMASGGYMNDYLTSCEMYDMKKDKWTAIASLNVGRQGHLSFAPNKSVAYVYGGYRFPDYLIKLEKIELNSGGKRSWQRVEVVGECIDKWPTTDLIIIRMNDSEFLISGNYETCERYYPRTAVLNLEDASMKLIDSKITEKRSGYFRSLKYTRECTNGTQEDYFVEPNGALSIVRGSRIIAISDFFKKE